MTFVTLPFFIFVAAVTLAYFLAPRQCRWVVLLLGSYYFYWTNSAWLVLVLLGTTWVTFGIGLWLQRVNDQKQTWLKANGELPWSEVSKYENRINRRARCILLLGVAIDLGALLFLKYFNFFGQNINRLLSGLGHGSPVPVLKLLLPLGISFYTLQAIAYMVDVYRGDERADRNPFKFMLFMSFFPQIVQGPIPRHDKLAVQLYEPHDFDYTRMCHGVQLMVWGLIKKLVIAERLAVPTNYLFDHFADFKGPILLFASAMYGLQVYTDFSGGMDIARGVAHILGIELELNFTQPYFSSSIEEFWRRWHITMGSWMKDYVFYPLSLSEPFTNLSRKCRKVMGKYIGKRIPAFLAMFIVYFLVGFWHGPNWKYVAYGIWNGVFIMSGILLESTYARCRKKLGIQEKAVTWRLFRIIRTFILVSIGRFFSGAADLRTALDMIGRMFMHWRDITFIYNGTLLKAGLNTANWFLLFVMLMLLFFVDFMHEKKVSFRQVLDEQPLVFRWLIYIATVLVILIFGYYGPQYDAASFIYAGF